ncbi:NAD(P)/FAD-dependent oxidoreductase [Maledivibacter halophilus]|uniref:NAD(P)/FAD-dependent oxidoreductase n=1 Tax=Maledivibacter halophilus TaxID=36842 RepID=UPI002FE56EB2
MVILKYDVIIVGAGPAGIFTALELVRQETDKKILIVEKGKSIDKRYCPKEKTKECVLCKPYCHITTGFSGAGAFSDGKLSLSHEVGGDLPKIIGKEKTQDLINYTDEIYLKFGADPKVEGLENNEAIKEIRRKAIEAGLKLVDCPIRHLGTEKAQDIYFKIQNYLLDSKVEIKFDTVVTDIVIEEGSVKAVKVVDSKTKNNEKILKGDKIIIATGRMGADWLKNMCVKHEIDHVAGTVDIGVRVEVRNEIMEKVNNVLYESKLIGYPEPFRNKVRTFCQNPGGFVSQENYDDDLAIVNGHSYKDKKSNNTNLAILSSHNFSEPFNQPIEYGKKVAKLVNMLGNGRILVQRFGDILDGKRTWQNELDRSNVKPTLPDAVAGDITSAIPYRPMMNIINFIKAMNTVVPGFASRETLLYGPEIKFYSNKINLDKVFETNIKGLHCLGDSSGWTRGLMMASVMGVLMGRIISKEN